VIGGHPIPVAPEQTSRPGFKRNREGRAIQTAAITPRPAPPPPPAPPPAHATVAAAAAAPTPKAKGTYSEKWTNEKWATELAKYYVACLETPALSL
jgi:hypothetical protein